jgi:hypothetical protein
MTELRSREDQVRIAGLHIDPYKPRIHLDVITIHQRSSPFHSFLISFTQFLQFSAMILIHNPKPTSSVSLQYSIEISSMILALLVLFFFIIP